MEMQCMWYEVAAGEAALASAESGVAAAEAAAAAAAAGGETDAAAAAASAAVTTRHLGLALKRFLATVNHFADFDEDAFDFHAYCVRKATLRSYVEMLREAREGAGGAVRL